MTPPPPPENAIYPNKKEMKCGMVSVRFIRIHCMLLGWEKTFSSEEIFPSIRIDFLDLETFQDFKQILNYSRFSRGFKYQNNFPNIRQRFCLIMGGFYIWLFIFLLCDSILSPG